jgi:hypothetical protein
MSLRRRVLLGLIALAVLVAGAWLWRAYGLQVWLEQAIAYCL